MPLVGMGGGSSKKFTERLRLVVLEAHCRGGSKMQIGSNDAF